MVRMVRLEPQSHVVDRRFDDGLDLILSRHIHFLGKRAVTGNRPGVYFLGLPWLTMRGSSFIWGVYQDAKHLAAYIEKSAAAAA